MGRRFAILAVVGLCLMSSASLTTADGGRSGEGMSIILAKDVWTSDEAFEATVGLWGLSSGRSYTLDWEIRAGNGSGLDTPVRSGTQVFTATSGATQLAITANHLTGGANHLHRLIADLSDSQGVVQMAQTNFSSFTNSLPMGHAEILFFGDSLSDMGNSYNQWGTPDSPPYWNGRFSNGAVWSEGFGSWSGVSMNPGRGSQSGNNRAYGGAHSGDGSYLFVIPNVGKQVDDFLQNQQIGQNTLVVILCGGNDFVHSDEQNPQVVVDNIESHMDQLAGSGATEFLIIELPGLDAAPRVQEEKDDAETAAFHARILDYNRRLHSMLDDKANTTQWTLHRGMVWDLFDSVLNNPDYFGITNTTHPACDHDGYTCEDGDPIAPNAEEYVFFDKMHPTGTMHAIMDLFAREVMGTPDVDGDGLADVFDNCPDTLPGVEIGQDGCDLPPPDRDGDGVEDELDACPNTPAGEVVDAVGCAESQLDDDDDGVMNDADVCPGTSTGAAVDGAGCSAWQRDGDGDGVVDATDLCPNTPAASEVDADGCAASQRDGDADGVKDDRDACPDTPRGEAVNHIGCSSSQLDADLDGVSDAQDDCPDTAANATDVSATGCAPDQRDSDEDGVTDDLDECPFTDWLDPVDEVGCAAPQRDTDGDGPSDADDQCPALAGSVGGCPRITVELTLVEVPSTETGIANISVHVSCENLCLLNVESDAHALFLPMANVSTGTFHVEVHGDSPETFVVTARAAEGIITGRDTLFVAFPPPQDSGGNPEDPTEKPRPGDERGQPGEEDVNSLIDVDAGSMAMIAMLLLLNVLVVAAILSARGRARRANPERAAISAFERDLFGEPAMTWGEAATALQPTEQQVIPDLDPRPSDGPGEAALPSMDDLL